MPRTRDPYPAEFREQIIALARGGRCVESHSREFEPCVATIHDWVKQAGIEGGICDDGLTSAERHELQRLRKENRQLRTERDILSKGEPLKAPLVRAQWRTPGLQTKAEARMAIFEFIEGWYNRARRHSALRYQSPMVY